MSGHALLSPSSAERWLECPGSVALTMNMRDTSSSYADEGTAAHEMAQLTLESGAADADRYIGKSAHNGILMTEEMAEHVMTYVNNVRDYAKGNELMIEQRLSISHLTGEKDAKGTSDAVIIAGDELQVHDLKYGMGVRKDAEQNEQLMIYALAALYEFEMLGPFSRVRLVIHQPRLNHLSEWDCSIEELEAFAAQVQEKAKIANAGVDSFLQGYGIPEDQFKVGETQCRFCKGKADCETFRTYVLKTVAGDDFTDLTVEQPLAPVVQERIDAKYDNRMLGALMDGIDLIETWCKAIRAKAEAALFQGEEVPGYKLVQGRMGPRQWADESAAEAIMKSMRLKQDEMYSMKLISPPQAEKLLKDTPKRWNRLTDQIIQEEGGPSVAPISDKRPALEIRKESFDPVEEPQEEALEGLV